MRHAHRMSSGAPTWRGAFQEDGFATVTATARTDRMRPTALVCISDHIVSVLLVRRQIFRLKDILENDLNVT